MSIATVVAEVGGEVQRQLGLWGTKFDNNNTANDWGQFIVHYLGKATYCGRASEYSPEKFRKNMKKVAALAVSAMYAVDRNGDCAPRHYENLPGAGSKEPLEKGTKND